MRRAEAIGGIDVVVAVTLELWADEANDAERSCCSASAVRLARGLAHRMGLPHFTLDLREQFRAGVVDPFLADWGAGLTPNPCIRCNGNVRLDAMLELADRLGANALATGHYARVVEPTIPTARCSPPPPTRGRTRPTCSPRSSPTRSRACASRSAASRSQRRGGSPRRPSCRSRSKADSQDLCFLAGTSRAAFLAKHGGIRERPGEIVDRSGRVIGRHRGHHGFTVGQRRGLGVATNEPLYVLGTDARRNLVIAGTRDELATTRVQMRGARLYRDGARVDRVKLRYRTTPLPARLVDADALAAGMHRTLEIELGEPVDGAAPGQMACLMDGETIVGWGTIAAADVSPAPPAPRPSAIVCTSSRARTGGLTSAGPPSRLRYIVATLTTIRSGPSQAAQRACSAERTSSCAASFAERPAARCSATPSRSQRQ